MCVRDVWGGMCAWNVYVYVCVCKCTHIVAMHGCGVVVVGRGRTFARSVSWGGGRRGVEGGGERGMGGTTGRRR